jgi:thymidine kinase
MIYNDGKAGFLTSIIGPMFSEKSGELIKRCLLAQNYQGKKVVVYKPMLDNRYSKDEVVSRIGLRIMAHRLEQDLGKADLQAVYAFCADADIVAFDEAQFFSHELVGLVEHFLSEGKHVIVAGLNLDFLGKPFGHLDEILLFSDEIEMKSAFCACCGRPAMYTQRLVDGQPVTEGDLVLIGDTESYEPRCRLCYVKKQNDPT